VERGGGEFEAVKLGEEWFEGQEFAGGGAGGECGAEFIAEGGLAGPGVCGRSAQRQGARGA
jgi:hypothetical protein